MRTITYYNFSELSDIAKKNAIKHIADCRKDHEHEFNLCLYWALDDCAFFEPTQEVMANLFGDDYYSTNGDNFMFQNPRTAKYSVDPDYIEDAELYIKSEDIEITNDTYFKTWLGIPVEEHALVGDIEFDWTGGILGLKYSSNETIEKYLDQIANTLTIHLSEVTKRFVDSINEYLDDEESCEEYANAHKLEFLEDGTIL